MRMKQGVMAATLATVALAGCSDSAVEPELTDIDVMRQATEQYQSVQAAMNDGFVQLSPCVASPAGGMGYHYGHPGRIENPTADPALPEILLYEPAPGGGLSLVGVEFMVHRDAWHGAGNGAAPEVAGRSYDPPDPNHPDEHLRDFYTLHVWVWKDNPAGMFNPFNPDVSCG
jgi:hypothetical protein